MYGIEYHVKVRMSKAYKNNMMQYIIDGARLWAGSKLLATSDDTAGLRYIYSSMRD